MILQKRKSWFVNVPLRSCLAVLKLIMLAALLIAVYSFTKESKNVNIQRGDFVLVDSIVINSTYPVEYICMDSDRSKHLFFVSDENKIVEYSIASRETNEILLDQNFLIYHGSTVSGIGYDNSDRIIVLTEDGLVRFEDDEWKIVLKEKVSYPSFLNRRLVQMPNEANDMIAFHKAPYDVLGPYRPAPFTRDFFTYPWLTKINEDADELYNFITLPESSWYMTAPVSELSVVTVKYFFDKAGDKLVTYIHPDNNIYAFDSQDSYKLSYARRVESEELAFRYSAAESRTWDIYKKLMVNDNAVGFTCDSDRCVISFSSGLDENRYEEMAKGYKDPNKILRKVENDVKYYCSIIPIGTSESEKGANLYLLPNAMRSVVQILDDRHFIMEPNAIFFERSDYSVFLIYRLN